MLLTEPKGTALFAAEGEGDQVAVSAYLYLYGEDARDRADAWTAAWQQRWNS